MPLSEINTLYDTAIRREKEKELLKKMKAEEAAKKGEQPPPDIDLEDLEEELEDYS